MASKAPARSKTKAAKAGEQQTNKNPSSKQIVEWDALTQGMRAQAVASRD